MLAYHLLLKPAREIDRKHKAYWEGAKVVKICRSGARIWKLKDGRYSDWRNIVTSPEVCE